MLSAGIAAAAFVGLLSGWFTGSLSIQRGVLYLAAALAVAFCAIRFRKMRHPWRNRHVGSVVPGIILAFVALIVWCHARLIGLPVVMYDVLSYHLPLAREFLTQEGTQSILRTPEIFYARMPVAAAIIEAPLVGTSNGGGFGVGIPAFVSISVLLGAWSAGRCAAWLGGRRPAQWCAVLLYAMHPLMLMGVMQSVYDPVIALLTISALELLLDANARSGSIYTASLSGLIAGTAVAMKVSAAGTALVPLGIVGLAAFLAGRRSHRLMVLAVFAAGVIMAVGPWLMRAQAIGGNPLFPFHGETATWTREQADFVVEQHRPISVLSGAYLYDAARKIDTLGYPIPGAGVSVLLLLAVAGAFSRYTRQALPLLAAAAAGYAAWLTVSLNPDRFLLPAAGLLCPVAAVGLFTHLKAKRHRVIGMLGIGLLVVMSNGFAIKSAWAITPIYTNEVRLETLVVQSQDYVLFTREVADRQDGELLLFFEARASLFAIDTVYRTVWDQPAWQEGLKRAQSAEEFALFLRGEGISTIFVNEFEWSRLLQFYAREQLPGEESVMGLIGVRSPLLEQALAAYPPYRFAGFTERDLTILADFLRSRRRVAQRVIPAGAESQVWYAPV